ncbi:hypothetical protein [Xanthomonas axonopodis]
MKFLPIAVLVLLPMTCFAQSKAYPSNAEEQKAWEELIEYMEPKKTLMVCPGQYKEGQYLAASYQVIMKSRAEKRAALKKGFENGPTSINASRSCGDAHSENNAFNQR